MKQSTWRCLHEIHLKLLDRLSGPLRKNLQQHLTLAAGSLDSIRILNMFGVNLLSRTPCPRPLLSSWFSRLSWTISSWPAKTCQDTTSGIDQLHKYIPITTKSSCVVVRGIVPKVYPVCGMCCPGWGGGKGGIPCPGPGWEGGAPLS